MTRRVMAELLVAQTTTRTRTPVSSISGHSNANVRQSMLGGRNARTTTTMASSSIRLRCHSCLGRSSYSSNRTRPLVQPRRLLSVHQQQQQHHHQQPQLYRAAGRQQGQRRLAKNEQRRRKATLGGSENNTSNNNSEAFSDKPWMDTLTEFLRQQRTIPVPRWVTPSHQTISISEVCGHSSFVLVALSYSVDDFLLLRCIAVVGSTAMLVFTYFHPYGRILWLPFKWNVLFIALNSYRIGKVLLERHFADNFPSDIIALRDDHFHLMDPVEFAKLVRLGTEESFQRGDVLVRQGQDNRHVRLVLEGELEVHRNGKMTYLLDEANFVSEAGLHSGLLLPGAVTSCCDVVARTEKVRVLKWDRDELLHLMERDVHMQHALQNAMSWDIVRKLKQQRFLASNDLVGDQKEWTQRRNEQSQERYTAILRNMLQHPKTLLNKKGRVLLHNYRVIHRIDDEHHNNALKELGWTPEQFENPKKHLKQLRDMDAYSRGWQWYLKDIYYRAFG
ncbi:hypothetical protein ACA910_005589 [Epithemia clementina (nom. ined.)]